MKNGKEKVVIKNCTAAELAEMLEGMACHPHNTGGLSMLDEATFAFGGHGVEIAKAQQAFASARHRHKRSYSTETGSYSDEAWKQAMVAAKNLADLLRPLGNLRTAGHIGD